MLKIARTLSTKRKSGSSSEIEIFCIEKSYQKIRDPIFRASKTS